MLKLDYRVFILVGVIAGAISLALNMAPLPQEIAYHHFADQRTWLAINNSSNVLSNLPFLFVGMTGLVALRGTSLNSDSKRCFAIFFAGVALTAFGSAWYHLQPDNSSLVSDRLPMTIAFMGLFAAVISEYISATLARRLLLPLLMAGLISVAYWSWTESHGTGDLRWYILVQFLPIVLIPLILWLYRGRSEMTPTLVGMLALYILAKFCEDLDSTIFAQGQLISGHAIKHLVAAGAAWLLTRFILRYKINK